MGGIPGVADPQSTPSPGLGIMASMDEAPAPAILRLADGALLVIELLPDGQIQHTRIEPDGSTSVDVVPRLQ